MLTDAIFKILTDHPRVKARLDLTGNYIVLRHILDDLQDRMHQDNLLSLDTGKYTKEEVDERLDILVGKLRNPHIAAPEMQFKFEHVLFIFSKILHLLEDPSQLTRFWQDAPDYPMNTAYLFAQAACYSICLLDEEPGRVNSDFNYVYNDVVKDVDTTLGTSKLPIWNRWQRRILCLMGLLSHPDPEKDDDQLDFREAIIFGSRMEHLRLRSKGIQLTAEEAMKKGIDDWTLLHHAVKQAFYIDQSLLDLGVDPNAVTLTTKSTVLHMASRRKDIYFMVKMLRNPVVNSSPLDLCGFTPLYYAAKYRFDFGVNKLLWDGATLSDADIHAKDHDGYTLFHYAAVGGYVGLAAALIKHHADPNVKENTRNQTPLHMAVIGGHTAFVKFMLDKSENLKLALKDNSGKTAYDHLMAVHDKKIDPDMIKAFERACKNNTVASRLTVI